MFIILTQNGVLNEVLTAVISAIGVGLVGLIGYGFTLLRNWLKTKIKSEKLQQTIDHTLGFVEDIVITVNQTYVDELVKAGDFCRDAQSNAFYMAKEKALNMIDEEGKALLIEAFGDLDEWITVVIESKVKEVKK